MVGLKFKIFLLKFIQAESLFEEDGSGVVHLDIHLSEPSGKLIPQNVVFSLLSSLLNLKHC